jgi:hypothetical protein
MRLKNSTQRFEVFVQDLLESFWGDFEGRIREALVRLLEANSAQRMAEHLGLKWHERAAGEGWRIDYRNGFYEREYVALLGKDSFSRVGDAVALVFATGDATAGAALAGGKRDDSASVFAGISTRGVGWVVSSLTEESVSAQTASRLTRVLDEQVAKFHHAALGDDWCYLLLDGVWLKVR